MPSSLHGPRFPTGRQYPPRPPTSLVCNGFALNIKFTLHVLSMEPLIQVSDE